MIASTIGSVASSIRVASGVKTASVNLTQTGNLATTPGWVNILLANIPTPVALGSTGWTVNGNTLSGLGYLDANIAHSNATFPDDVLRSLWFHNPGTSFTVTFNGLNPAKTYSIQCATAYSSQTGNGQTVFTATGSVAGTGTIVSPNFVGTVTLNPVTPTSGGVINVVMSTTTAFTIANAFIITEN